MRIRHSLTMFVVVGALMVGLSACLPLPITLVVSDQVTFASTSTGFSGTHQPTTCSLVSDDETQPYSCQLSFRVAIDPFRAGCAIVDGSLSSPDGTTTFAGVCHGSCASIAMSGSGTEADAPENGKPSENNPAIVNLALKRTSGCLSGPDSGTIVVSESSTSL